MWITADLVLQGGVPKSGLWIKVSQDGYIHEVTERRPSGVTLALPGKILVPGFVNAHSHAFQRLLRGRTQQHSGSDDNFWSWREAMYQVAERLGPEEIYLASRQAFLEMVLAGTTSVGEFHYVHHQPDGRPYASPNELSRAVIRAAEDVGLRICLLSVVYLTGDFGTPPSAHQQRFCAPTFDQAAEHIDALQRTLSESFNPRIAWGVAAHSVRAVPEESLVALKTRYAHQTMHIHVSEQHREVQGCVQHYGVGPIELLHRSRLLDGSVTLVHATHPREGELDMVADSGAVVCVCPTTESDLGDGLLPARELFERGIPMALGTDGQTQCSVLEEARRLEGHERLRVERRNVLTSEDCPDAGVNMLQAASEAGGRALGLRLGRIEPEYAADFVALDLDHPSLAGCDGAALPSAIAFSAPSDAMADVIVGGVRIVEDRRHRRAEEIGRSYRQVSARVWG